MLPVFGHLDEPHGHAEVLFENVRLPVSSIIAGPGRGFEIAQGRLGPGRIHHCMRAIGASERALERLCQRAVHRVAFGKPLSNLGGNRDIIANSRMAIDQARLLTLKAAWALDTMGTFGALVDISAIKVIAPNVLQSVVDAAIQIHGGEGMADPSSPVFSPWRARSASRTARTKCTAAWSRGSSSRNTPRRQRKEHAEVRRDPLLASDELVARPRQRVLDADVDVGAARYLGTPRPAWRSCPVRTGRSRLGRSRRHHKPPGTVSRATSSRRR